eukprot:NODE_3531_length_950_cov_54.630620_g3379_i0.p1 GENE.NODE_3531_length_950_cov_54.630620_g3379_i0~~NODE_3531_length_950_cov_54.630620_g3379_i0.p1  ORF type:complete len:315 (-),score=67.69 NODE_3531_length_950_cov_54.630620_g3379_i0:5-904(-)
MLHVICLLLSLPMGESFTWERLPRTNLPQARYGHTLTPPSATGQAYCAHCAILFGGYNGTHSLSDFHRWMDRQWAPLLVIPALPPRHHHTAVFHFDQAPLLLVYGGLVGARPSAELWVIDLNELTAELLTSQTAPPPLYKHAAVMSEGRMLVYGGLTEGTLAPGLWWFDWASTTWAAVTLPPSLAVPAGHTLTQFPYGYQGFLTVGGVSAPDTIFGGAEYYEPTSATQWVRLPSGLLDPPRYGHVATLMGDLLLYGFGCDESGLPNSINLALLGMNGTLFSRDVLELHTHSNTPPCTLR